MDICLIYESCKCEVIIYIYYRDNNIPYTPHPDFSFILNSSTDEIMQFEEIALPRNPSNTVTNG